MWQKELLASALKKVADNKNNELDKLKESYQDIQRLDFIWHYLLQSFSTMGRSTGWHGLIGNKDNYNQVTFSNLNSLEQDDREKIVNQVCRDAKVRMPGKKAEFILKCFEQIIDLGGVEEAKNKLLALQGRDKKIKFLMKFHGIGKKYARNIMMDVYHEDFRDSIAIDVRINAITELLGLSFKTYEEEEKFYLEAGQEVGLNGWEVDRLLYNYRETFESMLSENAISHSKGRQKAARFNSNVKCPLF